MANFGIFSCLAHCVGIGLSTSGLVLGPGYKDLDRLDYMWQGGGGQGGKVGSGTGPQSEQVSTYGASILCPPPPAPPPPKKSVSPEEESTSFCGEMFYP